MIVPLAKELADWRRWHAHCSARTKKARRKRSSWRSSGKSTHLIRFIPLFSPRERVRRIFRRRLHHGVQWHTGLISRRCGRNSSPNTQGDATTKSRSFAGKMFVAFPFIDLQMTLIFCCSSLLPPADIGVSGQQVLIELFPSSTRLFWR